MTSESEMHSTMTGSVAITSLTSPKQARNYGSVSGCLEIGLVSFTRKINSLVNLDPVPYLSSCSLGLVGHSFQK